MKANGSASIVGLLIAMVVSLIVLGAMIMTTIEQKQSISFEQSGVHNVHAKATVLMDYLHSQLSQSGYRIVPNSGIMPAHNELFSPSVISSVANGLSYRFQGDGLMLNCDGDTVASGVISTNTLQLQNGQLLCNNVLILEGIDQFQVLYGEDTNNDNTPNRFVAGDYSGLNMSNVVAVRVGLLIRGSAPSFEANMAQTYSLLGQTINYNDTFYRRTFVTTVSLRNMVP